MAYITVHDLSAELSDIPTTSVMEHRIELAQSYIETITGRFFEPRANYSLRTNGNGSTVILLPMCPVDESAITSVTVNGLTVDPTTYYVHMPYPNGRFTPKLVKSSGTWTRGELNIVVTGTFGFVEPKNDDDEYLTPPLVKELCKRIAIWALPDLGGSSSGRSSNIIEEQLGDYRYRLSERAESYGGMFGDKDIDSLLVMFKTKNVRVV